MLLITLTSLSFAYIAIAAVAFHSSNKMPLSFVRDALSYLLFFVACWQSGCCCMFRLKALCLGNAYQLPSAMVAPVGLSGEAIRPACAG